MSEIAVTFFGPLDTIVGPYIEEVLLVLVVSNMLTRKLAHDSYREQAVEGDTDAEDLSRHPLHVFSTWGMVLASLYYLTLHHHSGIVMSALVLGLFITDFFEFEARRVEISSGHDFERPKAAIVAWLFVFMYAAYQSVFFVVEPIWNSLIV